MLRGLTVTRHAVYLPHQQRKGGVKTVLLLQIRTTDFGLQLKTEITANTVEQLQLRAAAMVKAYPEVKGFEYGIYKITKRAQGGFDTQTLKIDKIAA